MRSRTKKILAVSSGGGHWVQLRRMIPALEGHSLTFVTVNPVYKVDVPTFKFYSVNDATSWHKFKMAKMALRMLWIVLREWPDVVISTGAAPGYFAIRFGKWIRAQTIWIDSIANVEHLSKSGRLVRPYADLWLTQWPHLAQEKGPHYNGNVIGIISQQIGV
ncbi:MAG: UDP-N-acetylglucosamine--LPS N-acetylglucosamine transferase [Phycisphaerae bacterium]